ncbi:hypothetical protein ACFQX4_18990 [Roseomonas sp. GCM10028921]
MTEQNPDDPGHDPGDSVPPGVAPLEPAPLSAEDKKVKRKLEELGKDSGEPPTEPGTPQGQAETTGPENEGR